MASIKAIIQHNNKTFYDYRSKKIGSPYPRLTVFLACSISISILFRDLGDVFMNAVLSVQSILIGFSFSVLFFLVSGSITVKKSDHSREKQYRVERLNVLANELFYNVAYYNTVSIGSVIIALLFLLPNFSIFSIISENYIFLELFDKISAGFTSKVVDIVSRILTFIIAFLLIDSIFTFFRIVKRVNFFFSEKLSLRN